MLRNARKGTNILRTDESQLIDEDHAGELYETAIKILKSEDPERYWAYVKDETSTEPPVPEQYAILEKIASDERSHKILLRVLTERLCP